MARHQHAVIWSRLSGPGNTLPTKMGDLVLLDETVSFTYTKDYLASGLPGFCLLGDGAIWGSETVTYPVSERIAVFPRLLSLIPGNNPRNLQRVHYLDMLRAESGKEPPPGIDTEWQLLLLGGHGGIGHVDVFADDITADGYYKSKLAGETQTTKQANDRHAVAGRSALWGMLKRNVLDENVDFDPQVVEQTLGPTPSVGGMIPKLLVSIDTPLMGLAIGKQSTDINKLKDSLDVVYYPPGSPGKTDVVLKVEPPEYQGLLDLEALCLALHREAGFEVPNWFRYDEDDLHFLAVERFDQVVQKLPNKEPIPMESLFSVIATGNHRFRETGDILLDELGAVFKRLRQVATLNKDPLGREIEEVLYRRILMALLTGNGDLHLDNISLLGGLKGCSLSPVYDPAPMRAWPRHNLVSAIPFDPTGYKDHGAYFVALGVRFGLSEAKTKECINDALKATAKYSERVMRLERVPMKQRQQLVEIAKVERRLLLKHR